MNVFKDYAEYYDLVYKDKDYKAEALYIDQLIQENKPGAKTILDLGCGTGNYAFELEKLGYNIVGVDLSAEMIQLAKSKKNIFNDSTAEFFCGDIRDVRLGRKFDVVVSLFHVMSYQTNLKDLEASFETATIHLDDGGLFLFDCWYGPGVLSDPPAVRHRIMENQQFRIHRIANPVINYIKNVVDVNYTIIINNKYSKEFYEVEETHKMRYWFADELNNTQTSFKDKKIYKWMSKSLLSNQKYWFILWLGKK